MIKNVIQKKVNQLFSQIKGVDLELTFDEYKKIKSSYSSKILAQKLMITEAMLFEFEEALRQYFQFKDEVEKSRLACFRISLWLETICKNLNVPFDIEDSISNEELAIKQVRALELIIRDVVNENLGGKQNVLLRLQELFKQDIINKWLKSADDSGILSGTTFSELSNIFLDKNIFKSIEDIFETSQLKLNKTSRESLRHILEDIRLIRNSIAHNKKISVIQIEALNEYYNIITKLIKEKNIYNINPDNYLDLDKANMESFLTSLREDNKLISTGIIEVKGVVKEIKKETVSIRKITSILIAGIFLSLIITGLILYYVSKQSGSAEKISQEIQDVKSIVIGDNELKNMTSTDDLTATKELNNRTNDVIAIRIAILYFDNSSGEPRMDKLKKGLADMLITDLSNINMLDIIERDKLEAILKEQNLSNTKGFDPTTAAKVGKLLGAEIILTGGYFDMMGSLRIDARFIDVETGKILKSDGVDGTATSFFKIQKQLSWKIIRNLDAKLSVSEKKELETMEKTKAITIEDLSKYSQALDFFDQDKKTEAKQIAENIVSKYPDFEPVKNLLKKLN